MLALTIEDIKLASQIVKNARLPKIIHKLSYGYYNCWGFTAFALKMTKKLFWMPNDSMENLLAKNTIRVTKNNLQNGDIVVYRGTCYGIKNYLLHTAIIIDVNSKKIIHKNGDEALAISTIYETEYTEGYWKNWSVTYRRMKNN